MKALKILLVLIALVIIGKQSLMSRGTTLKFKEGIEVNNITLAAKIKTSKGEINLNLFPETAPFTVTNFVTLSKEGYYNGLKFHRVIDDFMIQGGCPLGNGTGGPGYQFGDEFTDGVIFDKPGKLAMANAGPGTNGSQFFITHIPTDWLNHKHTIFGEVVSDTDQAIVNNVKQGDIIEGIEITGDVEAFLEAYEDFSSQIKDAVKK